MARTMKLLARPLLGLTILGLLLWLLVDVDQALVVVAGADWRYFILIILVMAADRLLMAYKWRLLVVCRGLPLSLGRAISSYFLATFAGCFLPSTIGADALRIAAVTGPGLPSAKLTASVVMERGLGFVAAALAALLGLFLLAGLAADLPGEFFYVAVGLLAASALAVVVSLSGLAARLSRRAEGRLADGGRLSRWLAELLAAYRQYSGHGPVLGWFFALTLLEQGALIVTNWLAARAFGLELGFLQAAAVTPVAVLLARLPISISSFGLMEGLYVAFFSLVGVGATEAFLLGLTQNMASLISALPGLTPYLGARRRGPASRAGGD
ncbi:hypothetical protein Deba_3082 [Desulfarculus baarsii DSM 2075]|uniref:Lysylphosphatidylglycerol synthetase/UPF0104 n=1 Tax=Desulfarculus baarsii (strain ATCC 33931 / DSM 2075 / LMG 7858 / VKM B-1802 / 2st14) TaxID=644282 RepID=E1QLK0_DESB2|nr:hypothetical protein Deba_3082 [Desulfarculus baarsii DSM 2075]